MPKGQFNFVAKRVFAIATVSATDFFLLRAQELVFGAGTTEITLTSLNAASQMMSLKPMPCFLPMLLSMRVIAS
mgnify:CR=1 FL=1